MLGAEEFARPAKFQIHLRDIKAVGGIHQRADALARGVVHFLGHQVQLRQPEAFRLLHHHHRSVGHIHAHLDHRGGNQNLSMSLLELLHNGFLFVAA